MDQASGPGLQKRIPAARIFRTAARCSGVSTARTCSWCAGETTLFAVGALCTHYHAPLADGLIVGDTVRCPMHHACFSLRTGEALRAPALDPIACWRVERVGDTVYRPREAGRTGA